MQLHGPEGQTTYVNPALITTLRAPQGVDLRHFPKGIHCVVVMTNGKFLPVNETCQQVYEMLQRH